MKIVVQTIETDDYKEKKWIDVAEFVIQILKSKNIDEFIFPDIDTTGWSGKEWLEFFNSLDPVEKTCDTCKYSISRVGIAYPCPDGCGQGLEKWTKAKK